MPLNENQVYGYYLRAYGAAKNGQALDPREYLVAQDDLEPGPPEKLVAFAIGIRDAEFNDLDEIRTKVQLIAEVKKRIG